MQNLPSFAKKIATGLQAREKILRGVNLLADCVEATLGPGGRNAIIVRPMEQTIPFSTRDGVTVAREVFLADELEDAGAQLVKAVAKKACDDVGDGTTTSVVLARAILNAGHEAIKKAASPVHLKRGINNAVSFASAFLASMAWQPTAGDILSIATISANGDRQIGQLVSAAIDRTGLDGVVSLEKSYEPTTRLEFVNGCQVESGWASPMFVNEPYSQECVLENPFVFLLDKKLSAFRELIPLVESIYKAGRSLLIIAETVEGEALATLVMNSTKKNLQVCCVRAPGHDTSRREALEDIAALTGATVISHDLGMKLSSITLQHLGVLAKASIGPHVSRLISTGERTERLEKRLEELRAAVNREQDQGSKERLQGRLAALSGGVAVIHCGGQTDLEAEERKFRIEDSLHAARCALLKGIVPGGGIALMRASQALDRAKDVNTHKDFYLGWKLLTEALLVPFRRIAQNAGLYDGNTLADALQGTDDWGLNALTGEWGYLKHMGVIDPLSVVLTALNTAASVASLVLLTESLIVMPLGDGQ